MSRSEYDISEYKTTSGVGSKMADVSEDSHALKEAFGPGSENKKFAFEAEVMAERIADWYDDPAAGLREYLSNAETACIRRAQMELRNSGFDVPDSTDEALEQAIEKCDYQPTVEVVYNRNPESTRLSIEDNGCGITIEEYEILRNIGYSASHGSGDRLGQFGMGVMSFLNIVGVEGMMGMSTRSFPSDGREETAYSLVMYATNMEYLDGLREQYGTRFEFPAFCQKAEGIPIRSKVEEFAEGMRVTVLYREMDNSGQEVYNEDYTPAALSADYDDSALVIEYENEFFEAVMSPHSPERRGYKTYNISMPIRRNTSEYGTEPKFNAPWTWDFRGKEENGPIVQCESDESVVGLAPVSDSKYENLPDERQPKFIRRSEVPDDAIVMPTPASSRDSYESGHDEFWRYVSNCLVQAWREEAADRIGSLTDFDDFKDASTRDKHIIVRGYQKFGPSYGKNETDTIVDHLKDELDIDVPDSVAEKLDRLQKSHRAVNRGADNPSYKKATSKTPAWQIIDTASGGGTVYMGKTISPKKAEIAWDLNDGNVVVRLEDEDYDELEELWGWSKLKDIPSRNLKEKLPNLSDDMVEKWESMSSSDYKSNSSGSRRTSRDPTSKRIKVYGRTRRTRRSFSTRKAGSVFDALDGGDTVSAGCENISRLIVFDQNEHSVSYAKRRIKTQANVGVAVVPKYVWKYLKDADNIYTSQDELRKKEAKDATVELSGDREVNITDLPDDELILVDAGSIKRRFEGDHDTLREWFEEQTGQQFKNLSFVDSEEFTQYHWTSPQGGTIFRFSGYSGPGSRFRVDGKKQSRDDIIEAILLPDDVDWDHEFMQAVRSGVRHSADKKMTVVQYLKQFDALPTVDDD